MPENQGLILFVDDDRDMRIAGEQWLGLAGFEVIACNGAEEALPHLNPDFHGILVTDVKMPRVDGLSLMRQALKRDGDLPVVLMTGHGGVAMAVQAMRDGAYDFIEKPFLPDTLVDIAKRALEKRSLVRENRILRAELRQKTGIDALLLGRSPQMVQLRQIVADLADTSVNVLIHGETGTGKEQVARSLHVGGRRSANPLVAVNCVAIPENIFESELFGHESGAFTGADRCRIGKLEHAHKGTLFLDEVEGMPLHLQVKLLRVLQEKAVERLGSNKVVPVDFRVVAATKEDLLASGRRGTFREDLYYRLNVAEVRIPSLRERKEDIPLLFEHFGHCASMAYERPVPTVDRGDMQALMAHDWPGNVRELKNIAERYVVGSGGSRLSLAETLRQSSAQPYRSLAEQVEVFEKSMIEQELARNHGDIAGAMEALALPRRTLNEKMRRYGLSRKTFL